MSNAEASSAPVPVAPRGLLRIAARPAERHPAAVYPSSFGSGSRRTMRQSLGVIANLVSGAVPIFAPWLVGHQGSVTPFGINRLNSIGIVSKDVAALVPAHDPQDAACQASPSLSY